MTWVKLNFLCICVRLCVSCLAVCVQCASMYALMRGEIPLSGLWALPVVELCLYSPALSGYPTLPMSERGSAGAGETVGMMGGHRYGSWEPGIRLRNLKRGLFCPCKTFAVTCVFSGFS